MVAGEARAGATPPGPLGAYLHETREADCGPKASHENISRGQTHDYCPWQGCRTERVRPVGGTLAARRDDHRPDGAVCRPSPLEALPSHLRTSLSAPWPLAMNASTSVHDVPRADTQHTASDGAFRNVDEPNKPVAIAAAKRHLPRALRCGLCPPTPAAGQASQAPLVAVANHAPARSRTPSTVEHLKRMPSVESRCRAGQRVSTRTWYAWLPSRTTLRDVARQAHLPCQRFNLSKKCYKPAATAERPPQAAKRRHGPSAALP